MHITVSDVDNIQDKTFKLHRPNGREDYLFVLFKSPSMVLIDGEYIRADRGWFVIFDKRKIQSYFACDDKFFLHDFIHFDLESDYEKLIFSEIPKGKLLHTTFPDAISGILSQIKSELHSTLKKYRKEILTNLGMAFLYKLKTELENSIAIHSKSSYFEELYKLRLKIYQNPQRKWSIENLSHEINLSRSYFQYLYKNVFAISCTEDVINAKIAHAKILLSGTSLTVNQIAEKCGYSCIEHFIRQFKSKTGISPNKFRSR